MRWGVRRYQNPDGSYTAAGRARYLQDGGNGVDYDREAIKTYDKAYKNYTKKNGFTGKHTQQFTNKIINAGNSSASGKKLKKMDNDLRKHDGYATKEFADEYNRQKEEYTRIMDKYLDDHMDEFAGCALKDMGLEDSELGRSYLRSTKSFRKATRAI